MNNLTAPSIQTDRLFIRMVALEDCYAYYQFCSKEEVCKYLTFNPYRHLYQAKHSIENMIRAHLLGSDVNFSIILKNENKVIGSISLSFKDQLPLAEVGYILDDTYWHNGYMDEALKAIIKACKEYYHLTSIVASYISLNKASERLLAKNQFVIVNQQNNGFIKNQVSYTLVHCELKLN